MIDVKSFAKSLAGKPAAILGLGISNRAAITALAAAGADIAAWDDEPDNRKNCPAPLADLSAADMVAYGCLVMAPGISLTHPVAVAAQRAGIEILCDIEILHRCGHGRRTIGVTGTNGKSTTTALIGHILNESGMAAVVGGNIGRPVLGLDLPPTDGAVVMEMSSFQLDICPSFAPDIAVHLNLTPDHLDRHGTMERYAEAKMRIFRGGGGAVIGVDDDWSRRIYKTIEGAGLRRCVPVAIGHAAPGGVYVERGRLFDAMARDDAVDICEMKFPALQGVHNHQNAAAAYVAARLAGVATPAIVEALRSFPGLPHRQFLVRSINGVAYVNDSKATNAAAAGRALESFDNIYWILGGRPKEGGLDGLAPYMGRVRQAFLIGEAQEEFAGWLDNQGVAHNFCGTIDVALAAAHALAQSRRGQPGGTGTVLLSPACASFDQFKNFEQRGEMFSTLVRNLPEEAA